MSTSCVNYSRVNMAVLPNAPSLMLTASQEWPDGYKADISVTSTTATDANVPTTKAAVMIYDRAVTFGLYYKIGIGTNDSGTINWGEELWYGYEKNPSVTLIPLEGGDIHAFASHCSVGRSWSFCIGDVKIEEKRIEWNDSVPFTCSAVHPKVSASSNGTVAIVHEESYSFYDKLRYHIARFVGTEFEPVECCEVPNVRGVEPDVAINNDSIVIVCRSGFSTLRAIVGKYSLVDNIANIDWGNCTSLPDYSGSGILPSISINDGNNVVETHQTKFFRRIIRVHGVIAGKCIEWSTDGFTKATFGEYPTIALAEDGYVIEAHKTYFGRKLFVSEGKLDKQH